MEGVEWVGVDDRGEATLCGKGYAAASEPVRATRETSVSHHRSVSISSSGASPILKRGRERRKRAGEQNVRLIPLVHNHH